MQHKKNETFQPIIKYTGIGIQMAVVICVFAWFGNRLDVYLELKKPLLTLLFLLLATCGSIFMLVKQLK